MKFPDSPRPGVPVEKTVRDILSYLRSITVTNMVGGRVQRTAGGTSLFVPPPPRNKQPEASHPWKVSTSADDTVRVSPGKILSLQCPSNPGVSNIPAYFHLKKFSDYAGGEVTGIDDNGYIYGSIPWATGGGTFFEADTTTGISMFELVVPDAGEPITVSFDTILPTTGDVFVFEIAHVTFADGKISEIEQVLTHNPTMWGFDIPPEA